MGFFSLKRQVGEASEGTSDVSPINYPFRQNSFESLHIFAYRSGNISGGIEFKNGMTKGQQDFKANSIRELLTQMEAFIAKLDA